MRIKKGFVVRTVGGSHVAVPVGTLSKEFHGMINLNETGAFMWNFFTEEHTEEECIEELCKTYDVARKIAETDVARFVKVLQENCFLEP